MKARGLSSRTPASGANATPSASSRFRVRGWVETITGRPYSAGRRRSRSTSWGKSRGESTFSSRWQLTTKYSPAVQPEPREHVGGVDLRPVVLQHLVHGAAGLDDAVGGQALGQQVVAGDVAVGQVDVGDVVDDPAVDLLGHALVEAAVARLHVEDGDLPPLGGDGRQTAVGVAQDEHGVGADLARGPRPPGR